MKIKDVGKAIGELELNNFPKLIKAIGALIISLILRSLYLVAKSTLKLWYVCISIVIWAMLEGRAIVWNDPEIYDWGMYTHIGPISISDDGFIIMVCIIAWYVFAYKLVNKLSSC